MSFNSVCNNTRVKQIGLPLRVRPILLSLIRLQTELNSSRSSLTPLFIICLAPRAGKMDRILGCYWLSSAVYRKKIRFFFDRRSYKKSFMTKLVRSRWLDIGWILDIVFSSFLRVYGPRRRRLSTGDRKYRSLRLRLSIGD